MFCQIKKTKYPENGTLEQYKHLFISLTLS